MKTLSPLAVALIDFTAVFLVMMIGLPLAVGPQAVARGEYRSVSGISSKYQLILAVGFASFAGVVGYRVEAGEQRR